MKTILALLIKRPLVVLYYFKFRKLSDNSVQQTKLREKAIDITNYHLRKKKGYKAVLDCVGYKYNENISNFEMWNQLPIMSKDKLRTIDLENERVGKRCINGNTGGSTGEPLKYLMTVKDYSLGMALLFRGWGKAGYRLGDKVAIIAGRSLIGPQDNSKVAIKRKINDFFLNFKHFPSTDMSDEVLWEYCKQLNIWKPKFLRGYVSSIVILANFIEKNHIILEFDIKGIMTTAENLLNEQRLYIESIFKTKVFDNYGLEDSGVSAYECTQHNGLHIDNERAYVQVLDNGIAKDFGEGLLIGTALYNKQYPFIKYNTGDIGRIEYVKCRCGIEGRMITKIQGRETDFLELNGIKIGGPVLTTLWNGTNIKQYQIIQNDERTLELRLVKNEEYSYDNENDIVERFKAHFGNVEITIKYYDILKPIDGNKLKYIVRKEKING